jgi:membrane protease YdiL (CAAX protease family)
MHTARRDGPGHGAGDRHPNPGVQWAFPPRPSPPPWAPSVFAPSLSFGWFRERHRGVVALMGLHILFSLELLMAASLPLLR